MVKWLLFTFHMMGNVMCKSVFDVTYFPPPFHLASTSEFYWSLVCFHWPGNQKMKMTLFFPHNTIICLKTFQWILIDKMVISRPFTDWSIGFLCINFYWTQASQTLQVTTRAISIAIIPFMLMRHILHYNNSSTLTCSLLLIWIKYIFTM